MNVGYFSQDSQEVTLNTVTCSIVKLKNGQGEKCHENETVKHFLLGCGQ